MTTALIIVFVATFSYSIIFFIKKNNFKTNKRNKKNYSRKSDKNGLSEFQRRLKQKAEREISLGKIKSTASLLLQAGLERQTITILERNGFIYEAAKILVNRTYIDRAATLYERNHYYSKAADLYCQVGQFEKAVNCYRHLGQTDYVHYLKGIEHLAQFNKDYFMLKEIKALLLHEKSWKFVFKKISR